MSINYTAMANDLEEKKASFWRPEEGDALGGLLKTVEAGAGVKGDSKIYTLETETGELVSFWGSAVLDNKLSDARAGDIVLLKYFGKRTTDKGTTYKNYRVEVKPAPEAGKELPF